MKRNGDFVPVDCWMVQTTLLRPVANGLPDARCWSDSKFSKSHPPALSHTAHTESTWDVTHGSSGGDPFIDQVHSFYPPFFLLSFGYSTHSLISTIQSTFSSLALWYQYLYCRVIFPKDSRVSPLLTYKYHLDLDTVYVTLVLFGCHLIQGVRSLSYFYTTRSSTDLIH